MGRPRKSTTTSKNNTSKTKKDKEYSAQPISNDNKVEENTYERKCHVVTEGESIQSIAGLYSVPVMKLIMLNKTTDVYVGQKIYID